MATQTLTVVCDSHQTELVTIDEKSFVQPLIARAPPVPGVCPSYVALRA
jgi:hypothetical protein